MSGKGLTHHVETELFSETETPEISLLYVQGPYDFGQVPIEQHNEETHKSGYDVLTLRNSQYGNYAAETIDKLAVSSLIAPFVAETGYRATHFFDLTQSPAALIETLNYAVSSPSGTTWTHDLVLSISSHLTLACRTWTPNTHYTTGGITADKQHYSFQQDAPTPDYYDSRADVVQNGGSGGNYRYLGEFVHHAEQAGNYPWEFWVVAQPGISDDVEPDWESAAVTGTVNDGEVIWIRVGCVFQKIYN